jgi:hypothetical protein
MESKRAALRQAPEVTGTHGRLDFITIECVSDGGSYRYPIIAGLGKEPPGSEGRHPTIPLSRTKHLGGEPFVFGARSGRS